LKCQYAATIRKLSYRFMQGGQSAVGPRSQHLASDTKLPFVCLKLMSSSCGDRSQGPEDDRRPDLVGDVVPDPPWFRLAILRSFDPTLL